MSPHSSENPTPDAPLDIDVEVASDIAALADDSLPAERRHEILQRISGSPELQAMLDEQRHALGLLATASEIEAPETLHARVDELVSERRAKPFWRKGIPAAPRSSRFEGEPRRRRRTALAGAGALALVAVAAVAIALVAGGGGAAGPTLHEYVALGSLAATGGPPAKSGNGSAQLAVSVDGVPFPYWEDQFGWRARGVRSGNIAGHAVTTVFYSDHAGRRVSYSIVAGTPQPLNGLAADRAVAVWHDGERYWIANVNGTPAVVWMRDGRRCILAGRGLSSQELLALASWSGQGEHAA
jgi:hypothetical protein